MEVWGTTQIVGILEQLEMGIRFFDFQVFYHSETDDFYNGYIKGGSTGMLVSSFFLRNKLCFFSGIGYS